MELGEEEVRDAVIQFMPFSFQVVNEYSEIALAQERKYIYTTPKSFLELIKLFSSMLNQKKENLEKNRERYENGLIRLQSTAEQVAGLEETLKIKQVEVDKKKIDADAFAQVVGVEKVKVEKEASIADKEA